MNKPFDLLAAQKGALIQQSHYLPSDDNDKWFDVRFVGVMSDGDIVLERTPNHVVTAKRRFLRMSPVKRSVFVVIGHLTGVGGGGGMGPYECYDSLAYTTREMAESVAAARRDRGLRASVHVVGIEE